MGGGARAARLQRDFRSSSCSAKTCNASVKYPERTQTSYIEFSARSSGSRDTVAHTATREAVSDSWLAAVGQRQRGLCTANGGWSRRRKCGCAWRSAAGKGGLPATLSDVYGAHRYGAHRYGSLFSNSIIACGTAPALPNARMSSM